MTNPASQSFAPWLSKRFRLAGLVGMVFVLTALLIGADTPSDMVDNNDAASAEFKSFLKVADKYGRINMERRQLFPSTRSKEPNHRRELMTWSLNQFSEAIKAGVAFYERHPSHPLRWDAIALAQCFECEYASVYASLLSLDKPEFDSPASKKAYALELSRRLHAEGSFMSSPTWKKVAAYVDLGLVSTAIDPTVWANLAAYRMEHTSTWNRDSYFNLRRLGAPAEILSRIFDEATRLRREYDQRFPDGAPDSQKDLESRPYLWQTTDNAHEYFDWNYWGMVKSERGEEQYIAELKKALDSKWPATIDRIKSKFIKEVDMMAAATPVEFQFTAIDGTVVDSNAWKGKIVLLNFWATWCAPCIDELPEIRGLYERYHDKGLEIVGISIDSEEAHEKFARLCRTERITWPQHFDGKGRDTPLFVRYGLGGVPGLLLLSEKGKVVSTRARGASLEGEIRKLLRLPPQIGAVELVPYGSEWHYLDTVDAPAADWVKGGGTEGWRQGRGLLGYGYEDTVTEMKWGKSERTKQVAAYFVKEIDIAQINPADSFAVNLKLDDGAVVYVNGQEIGRINMPEGLVTGKTFAKEAIAERKEWEIKGSPGALKPGRNVVAVSVHQSNRSSSDLAFDLQLVALPAKI